MDSNQDTCRPTVAGGNVVHIFQLGRETCFCGERRADEHRYADPAGDSNAGAGGRTQDGPGTYSIDQEKP